jgi:undecaprenyl-diphosphatase
VTTPYQKLAWMIIFATIPVGLVGLKFEHVFRVLFGKPIRAAIFLVVNGLILYAGEKFRTRKSLRADAEVAAQRVPATGAVAPAGAHGGAALAHEQGGTVPAGGAVAAAAAGAGGGTVGTPVRQVASHASGNRASRIAEQAVARSSDERLTAMSYWQAVIIGSVQILALLAGISRDGVTMVAGMFRGLSREDAARFAFLLATPVILAAGVLKLGDLVTLGKGIYGPIIAGSILSGVGAYVSVRFLVRYFQTRTLTPFAIYCVLFGLFSIIYLQVK